MTDDSKPKDDALSHSDEDQEVVDTAPRPHADDQDDDVDDDDDEPVAPSAKARAGVKKKGKKSKALVAKARPSGAPKASGSSGASSGASAGLLAAVALVAGAAAGWFANEARGKAPSADVHAAAAGESTCQAWSKAVCKGAGDKSSACTQTKDAAALLPDAACSAALAEVPATLAKVKDARKDCTKLVDKLCTDLGKTTGTCKMVTERTETFPTDRCKEMMANYDKVLGQLKAMEERGGPGGPGMNPHGASPHGPGGPGMPGGHGMPGAPGGMPRLQAGPPGSPAGLPPGAVRLGPKPAAPGAPAPKPAAPAPAPAPKPAQ